MSSSTSDINRSNNENPKINDGIIIKTDSSYTSNSQFESNISEDSSQPEYANDDKAKRVQTNSEIIDKEIEECYEDIYDRKNHSDEDNSNDTEEIDHKTDKHHSTLLHEQNEDLEKKIHEQQLKFKDYKEKKKLSLRQQKEDIKMLKMKHREEEKLLKLKHREEEKHLKIEHKAEEKELKALVKLEKNT